MHKLMNYWHGEWQCNKKCGSTAKAIKGKIARSRQEVDSKNVSWKRGRMMGSKKCE